jgi:hypothetical protein
MRMRMRSTVARLHVVASHHPALPHNSRMPRDPVKRKASKQRYTQSDKGKATAQAYDQSDQGKARYQRYDQSDKGKATAQRYNQSDQGKAAKQRAASAAAERAASAASASLAFVTELKGQPHAQRVKDYFSEAGPVRPGGAGARRPTGGLHLPRLPRATRFNQRPAPPHPHPAARHHPRPKRPPLKVFSNVSNVSSRPC